MISLDAAVSSSPQILRDFMLKVPNIRLGDILTFNLTLNPMKKQFKDGPEFRSKVQFLESSALNLEISIQKVSKIMDKLSLLSEEYSEQTAKLTFEIKELACYPGLETLEDPKASLVENFTDAMKEIERSRRMMVTHVKDVLVEPLLQYIQTDIVPVKVPPSKYHLYLNGIYGN